MHAYTRACILWLLRVCTALLDLYVSVYVPVCTCACVFGQAAKAAASKETEAASTLPSGWQQHLDPTSGRPYYCNSQMGMTQWEVPAEPMQAKAAGSAADGWRSLKAAKTGKGSTAVALARADIPPDSPASPALARIIDAWLPRASLEEGGAEAESDEEDDTANAHREDAGPEQDAVAEVGHAENEAQADPPPPPPTPQVAAPLPAPPPTIITWMRNDASAVCTICGAAFALFRRRHHCRSCGRLVCAACGPRRAGPAERTCEPCASNV